jgi:hydrogenase/urease accessory protein HupE
MEMSDKNLVIIAVSVITLAALFVLGPDSKEIITNAFSGLFGLVTGYVLHDVVRNATKPDHPKDSLKCD